MPGFLIHRKSATGGTYAMRHHVPAALRRRGWPAYVEKSLETSDRKEAERRLPDAAEKLQATFASALSGAAIGNADIERLALAEAAGVLSHLSANPKAFDIDPDTGDCAVDAVLWHYGEALESADFDDWHGAADKLARDNGLTLNDEQRDRLTRLLLTARVNAYHVALEIVGAVRGKAWRGVKRPSRSDSREVYGAIVGNTTWSEAAQSYKAAYAATWAVGTARQYNATVRLFGEYVGSKPLAKVMPGDVRAFLATMATLHKDYGKGARTVSLSEARRARRGEPRLSAAALARHAGVLREVFRRVERTDLVEALSV